MPKPRIRATIDCSQPIIVRPEFGPDTDIKTILRRHGGLPAPTRQPVYTETDFDADLTSALAQMKRAHEAFEALPKKHREKFQTADELWQRYRTDNLRQDAEAEKPPEQTPGEPPKPQNQPPKEVTG